MSRRAEVAWVAVAFACLALRLPQLGTAGRFFWSIHELNAWER